jgi:uncharacterized protein (TIGR00730 family)
MDIREINRKVIDQFRAGGEIYDALAEPLRGPERERAWAMQDSPAGRPGMRVTVFAGSSMGSHPGYVGLAADLGRDLALAGVGVVYGGSSVGLMGLMADAAMAAGGEVIGVIPQVLVEAEVAADRLTRLEVVSDLHQRKARMAELGDAFVALPGGLGTLEELTEALTWRQLGLHAKPVVLLDANGFWTPLLDLLDAQVSAGFVAAASRSAIQHATSPAAVLKALLPA